MEIERKFLVSSLPEDLESYPASRMQQAYIHTDPVIRIRKADDQYELTVKGRGLLSREELNLPLSKDSFETLLKKHEGRIIEKTRYRIPYGKYTIELDVFRGVFEGRILAEVEFPTEEEACQFVPPSWFLKDVTLDPAWHNANMAFEA